jgi:hypothetical protein
MYIPVKHREAVTVSFYEDILDLRHVYDKLLLALEELALPLR